MFSHIFGKKIAAWTAEFEVDERQSHLFLIVFSGADREKNYNTPVMQALKNSSSDNIYERIGLNITKHREEEETYSESH